MLIYSLCTEDITEANQFSQYSSSSEKNLAAWGCVDSIKITHCGGLSAL